MVIELDSPVSESSTRILNLYAPTDYEHELSKMRSANGESLRFSYTHP